VRGHGGQFTILPAPPPTPDPRTAHQIKYEELSVLREQKINSGFTFNGIRFQSRPDDRENIAGASQLAFMAIVAGAQPGNLRWHEGSSDFAWIAEDNSIHTMDAHTVVAFAQCAANYKSACIFYARYLKDQIAAAEYPASVDILTGWPSDSFTVNP
jgi:hypothetical protein